MATDELTLAAEQALATEAEGLWLAMEETKAADAAALAAGAGVARLRTNREAALQKAMVGEGWTPVSDEFAWEYQGRRYVGQWGEQFEAHLLAVWYCAVGEWDRVSYAEVMKA